MTRRLPYLLLALLPLAYAALALSLGQDANWDLKNYHWYNGYALLQGRFGFDLLPSQTPFFYNPILDAGFYALAHALPAWLASAVLAMLQALNGWLIFAITRRCLRTDLSQRNWYALGTAVLALFGGGTLAELGTCFYDNIVSLGVFASLYLALRGLQGQRDWTWFCLAGIPVGIATGCKLPTAIFCVGLCGALFMMRGSFRSRCTRAFTFGIGILIGLALSYGYWGAYLWHAFQNPLFPYFNNIFHSTVTLPTSARDMNFVPGSTSLRLLFPFAWTADPKLVGEVPFRDLKLPLLYALLPLFGLVALWYRKQPQTPLRFTIPEGALVLWSLGIAYAAWLFMFGIYRYAVPLEMLAAPALLIMLDRLLKPSTSKRSRQNWIILSALVCFLSVQIGDWSRTTFGSRMVTVDWPPLLTQSDASQTMILMAGFQPYSHIVPELPPAMPVIRLQSNFASPGEPKGINDTIKQRIAAWPGRFLFLIPVYDAEWIGKQVLPQFGLKAQLDNCQIAHPNFSEDFSLCPVSR